MGKLERLMVAMIGLADDVIAAQRGRRGPWYAPRADKVFITFNRA